MSQGGRRAAVATMLALSSVLGCEFGSATGAPGSSGTGDEAGSTGVVETTAIARSTSGAEGDADTGTDDVAVDSTAAALDATDPQASTDTSSGGSDEADDGSGSSTGGSGGGAGIVTTIHCDAPGVAIPDNDMSGVATQIVVPESSHVLAVRVQLGIVHPHVGDLRFDLRHGEADRLLVSYPGNGACSGDDIVARLTDDATIGVSAACTGDTPAIAGDVAPEFSLDAFVGLPMLGTWELRATDGGPADTGTVSTWCIEIDHLP